MSYIRCATPMRKRSSDKRFEQTSGTYAWEDSDGYIWITNGDKRILEYLKLRGQKLSAARKLVKDQGWALGTVILTPAEMRYMCRQFVGRELGELKGYDRRMTPVKPRKRKCLTCGGSGALMKEPFCPTCGGSGKVTR